MSNNYVSLYPSTRTHDSIVDEYKMLEGGDSDSNSSLLLKHEKISPFKDYNQVKFKKPGKDLIEQTHQFYDNQELAFANDIELK
jgi:hypothetical protein